MEIYITPEDAKHEEKTNIQGKVQMAVKSEVYTKEEVIALLKAIQKGEQ